LKLYPNHDRMRHFFDIAIQPEYNGRQVPVSRYVYKEMFFGKTVYLQGDAIQNPVGVELMATYGLEGMSPNDIDKNLPIPYHYQLRELLRDEITSGRWKWASACLVSGSCVTLSI